MSKVRPAPEAPLTRRHLSRMQREREQRRYVLIAAGVVAALVIGVLTFAVVDLLLLQPNQPVALVAGEAITTRQFQTAVRYRRLQLLGQIQQINQTRQLFGGDPQTDQFFENQTQQLLAQLSNTYALGEQVLENLIEDRLIRQEARRLGLTVSAAELDERLQEFFAFYPAGTPTVAPTASPLPTSVPPTKDPTRVAAWTPTAVLTPTATITPTATATAGPSPTALPTGTPRPTPTLFTTQAYATQVVDYTAQIRQQADVSLDDLRYLLESDLYRRKLQAALGADVATTQEQVWARHILVDDEALAAELGNRLQAGEDWEALAAEFSTDTSNAAAGGDLGWFGRGRMVPEFETAAFATEIGAISAPVQTQFGWHLIWVLDRQARPLSADEIEQARESALSTWLAAARSAADDSGNPVVVVNDLWISRVPNTPTLASLAGASQ